MEIKGRDLVEGVPKTLDLTDEEIREALSEAVATIVESGARGARAHAARALGRHHGQGHRHHRRRLAAAQPRPAPARRDRPAGLLAEDPLASVVLGTGAMLTDIDLLRKVSIT